MWTRKELKQRAKASLKRYRGAAIGACLILMILQGIASGSMTSSSSSSEDTSSTYYNALIDDGMIFNDSSEDLGAQYGVYTDDSLELDSLYNTESILDYFEDYAMSESGLGMFSSMFTTKILILGILLVFVRILLNFFIVNPVMVGHSSFVYKNRYEKTSIGELAFAFNREDLFPVVKTMFLRDLYITLWFFLLIIPGIVKTYAYRMVPFILAENPQMDAKEAIRLSNEMTRGHKWKMFVLDFSFYGWYFLGAMTFGFANIVWTYPYVYATEAELYHELKQPFIKQAYEADVF